MCIICTSERGVRQPTKATLARMFAANPHGAGYMYSRDGAVHISKGYMDFASYWAAIRAEHFRASDPVVYHCRISTQAGISPEMTQPFPVSGRLEDLEALDVSAELGLAHNGIIALTSDGSQRRYSDTALFIFRYLADAIDAPSDLDDPQFMHQIDDLTRSRLAFLDGAGAIHYTGRWITDPTGLRFSNTSYR